MLTIVDPQIKLTGLSQRSKTTRIIVHHSDSGLDADANQINEWHKARGWAGIGYHFVILPNGIVQIGRPVGTVGAHATGANNDSIGICLIGNFETGPAPTDHQMETLALLIRKLWTDYKTRLSVLKHSAVYATACPGKLFPWYKLMEVINMTEAIPQWKLDIMANAEKMGLIDPKAGHKPDDAVQKWFVLQVIMNALKGAK